MPTMMEKYLGRRYVPLNHDEEDLYADLDAQPLVKATRVRIVLALSLSLVGSLILNLVLLLHKPSPFQCPPDLGRSHFSGITFDTPTTYHSFTEFWNPEVNQSIADSAWDAIDTNPVAVALHDRYAKAAGLAPSTRFPWDTERSVYYLRGLHDMHCLKLIRKAIVSHQYGEHFDLTLTHIFHCLDALRQDIMCAADDTPMPAPSHGRIGDLQARQCRDWDKMVAWAQLPDLNACHRFDDYREAVHTLELFAFCPETSPYHSTMVSYFDYHGHKDPYESN